MLASSPTSLLTKGCNKLLEHKLVHSKPIGKVQLMAIQELIDPVLTRED